MAVRVRYGTRAEPSRESEGGGSTETKTVLWTNPTPTATQAAQDITLSDSMSNYDRIQIEFIRSTSVPTDKLYVDYDTRLNLLSDFHGTGKYRMSGCIYTSSNETFVRRIVGNSDTALNISACQKVSGTTTTNTILVLAAIYGIKSN